MTKPQGEVRHGYGTWAEQESSRGIQLEDILSSDNLSLAWKQVRANKGAAGVDGVEVGEFPDFYAQHWEMIHRKLMAGSYSPSPVRRVTIPKGKGQTRSLGIPAVLDRLIQQSIAQALTPQYEAVFSDRSHGFRPGRSAHHAIAQMHAEALPKGIKCHVVDCDLKAFFDTVDHQKLMGKLRESIADLQAYLRGAINYYGIGIPFGDIRELDQWERRRMRLYYWKASSGHRAR